MVGKVLRIIIILGLIAIAGFLGFRSYHAITDLFSFQISLYEWILQTQQKMANSQHELQGLRNEALDFLGKEQHATNLPPEDTIHEQLTMRKTNIQILAISISSIISIIVFKILFDIAFGIKSLIYRLKEFIVA